MLLDALSEVIWIVKSVRRHLEVMLPYMLTSNESIHTRKIRSRKSNRYWFSGYLLQDLLIRTLHLTWSWRQLPFMKYSRCIAPSRSETFRSWPFLGAPEPTSFGDSPKPRMLYWALPFCANTIWSAQLLQYLSIKDMSFPMVNTTSFVTSWSHIKQLFGRFIHVLSENSLIEEKILSVIIHLGRATHKNVVIGNMRNKFNSACTFQIIFLLVAYNMARRMIFRCVIGMLSAAI